MDKKLGYLLVGVSMLFSQQLFALTDAEIEQRLNDYEAKIKALEAQLKDVKKSPVYEQDLGKSSEKIQKQIDGIKAKMDAEQQKLKINGFMTAGVSQASDDIDTAYNISRKPSFGGDSKMGLQFNYNMDDRTDATVQLLARGRGKSFGNTNESWTVGAEWAYLGYKLTDDLKFRAGRLRVPVYMYSETLDVGYSYPWVRPPMTMYTTAITSYDGADMLYKFSTGSIRHVLQINAGGDSAKHYSNSDDVYLDVGLKDNFGANITSSFGSWTTRLMATTMRISGDLNVKTGTIVDAATLMGAPATVLPGLLGFQTCDLSLTNPTLCSAGGYLHKSTYDTFNYYSAGVQYDNGSLFVILEGAKLQTENANLFSDGDSGYMTAGYRFGSWTPFYTYGESYDTETKAILAANGLKPSFAKENSFGVRKEITQNLDAKFQYDHFFNMENENGFGGNPKSNTNIYTLTLDAVF